MEHRPNYEKDDYFLWHLVALGVASRDLATELWEAAKCNRPVRVAIIDNGVDRNHPNLQGAIDFKDVMDFSSHLYGTFYCPEKEQNGSVEEKSDPSQTFHARQQEVSAMNYNAFIRDGKKLSEILQSHGIVPPLSSAEIVAALEREDNKAQGLAMKDPSRFFAAHGTACAGLVGGRTLPNEAMAANGDKSKHKHWELPAGILPYFGVNPFCEIIPICTPYSHEILPVIHALLFAIVRGADIILMPRGLAHADDRAAVKGSEQSRYGTRITDSAAAAADNDSSSLSNLQKNQKAFEELLKEITKVKYVITAAGNDSFPEALAYPASQIGAPRTSSIELVGNRSNVGDGFLVATACNRDGEPSAYANGTSVDLETIPVLSDDGFAFHSDLLQVDPTNQFSSNFDLTMHQTMTKIDQSPWGVLSLDVSGPYGYQEGDWADGPEEPALIDRRASYTIFGGTSAASSILAGCISLYLQSLQPSHRGVFDKDDLIRRLNEVGVRLCPAAT